MTVQKWKDQGRPIMIARILVLCDSTAASTAARRFAFRLARRTGADLTGLGGVDLSLVEVRMPGGIGMAAHKARLEEALRQEAIALRDRLRAEHEAECRQAGLAPDWLSFEGEGPERVASISEGHDLIVAGYDAGFGPHQAGTASDMIAEALGAVPRPVLICPEIETEGGDVLIAYDGSPPAMRALQLFALSGVGKGKPVSVLAVHREEAIASRLANGPVAYLRRHGHMAQGVPLVEEGRPDAAILREAGKRRPEMLVMGAYGHRGLKALLFGSTTKALIASPPCPLFIYH
jgi:nucleotide-binding universal stress UspA family protein